MHKEMHLYWFVLFGLFQISLLWIATPHILLRPFPGIRAVIWYVLIYKELVFFPYSKKYFVWRSTLVAPFSIDIILILPIARSVPVGRLCYIQWDWGRDILIYCTSNICSTAGRSCMTSVTGNTICWNNWNLYRVSGDRERSLFHFIHLTGSMAVHFLLNEIVVDSGVQLKNVSFKYFPVSDIRCQEWTNRGHIKYRTFACTFGKSTSSSVQSYILTYWPLSNLQGKSLP